MRSIYGSCSHLFKRPTRILKPFPAIQVFFEKKKSSYESDIFYHFEKCKIIFLCRNFRQTLYGIFSGTNRLNRYQYDENYLIWRNVTTFYKRDLRSTDKRWYDVWTYNNYWGVMMRFNPYASTYGQYNRGVTTIRDYFVCYIIVNKRIFFFFDWWKKMDPVSPSFHDIDKLSLIRRRTRLNRRRQYRERVSEPADERSGWNRRGDGVDETTIYHNVVVVATVHRSLMHSLSVDR